MLTLLFLFSIHSPIILNEVLANPRGSESGTGSPGDRNEFLEIYNNSNDSIDLAGWFLTDFDATDEISAWTDPNILTRCPEVIINSTFLPAHGFAVILDPEYTSDDTTGGYVQPYSFPPKTLILTVGNTTLGDGLANTDPVLLYAPDLAESTSFGTPFDTLDSLPDDAGDGISWERIKADEADRVSNWISCPNSSGSTPGSENSTLSFRDLAISPDDISVSPGQAQISTPITVRATVHNRSFVPIADWELRIFTDVNHDSIEQPTERLARIPGDTITGQGETVHEYTWPNPSAGTHTIGVAISYAQDQDLDNNLAFAGLTVYGANEYLEIVNHAFNPENDSAVIDYCLPESNGYLTIAVYDLAGRTAQTLKQGKVSDIQGRVFWNGRNKSDRIMPVGIYIVNLEYRLDRKIYQAKKTVIVAKPL